MKSWGIAMLVNYKMIQFFKFIIPIFTLLVATGCDLGSSASKDESILTQTPCQFPCWHGITPGVSTMADVQQLIKTDAFITSSSNLSEATDGAGRTGFQWWYNGFDKNNRILVENGTVYSISVNPNLAFSLQDIVSKYGEPAGTHGFLVTSREGGNVDANLSLYYPDLGLEVGFEIKGGSVLTVKQFNIQPSISGVGFKLFAPQNSLNDFVAEIYSLQDQELSQFLASMTLGWPGFNSVIFINPDRTVFFDETFIATVTPSP